MDDGGDEGNEMPLRFLPIPFFPFLRAVGLTWQFDPPDQAR